ncbi:site-specific integrase [Dokdonella koreensis]|uniref:Site-specific recombinase, phage integrase family n=1 Tax=Dokdonella koreensis DS-123 TaxID=1300342 RepID=A0A160DW30_9GAMM|nr:site-specific integrase [Dokdonella koreensis]ANB18788.1 Site-specific recombinase, phage integrase family [Dokdonella koreensis DS-123]
MATITQLPSGRWRVQVRRKQSYASETFLRHEDARKWATATERRIDLGESPLKRAKVDPTTFAHLIDLHVEDMREVGRILRRSKRFTLDALKTKLGKVKLKDLTRERLIQFGKDRAKEGAGPVTLSADIGYLKLVLTHAAAVHGIDVRVEPVDLARVALKRLGLIGKSRQRDRRPTPDEIRRLLEYFEDKRHLMIPMGRIVRFAIASAMRQEEICRIRWSEVNVEQHVVLVRDRKDPREKDGNDQWVPLLNLGGFDALRLIRVQRKYHPRGDLIFPYNSRSVGAAFRRACRELKIQDLHFHDLRHEATSRLFEAGLRIEQVALVTGHRDWKMLKRYTHLRPEHLHRDRPRARASAAPVPPHEAARLLAAALATQWHGDAALAATGPDDDTLSTQDALLCLLQGLAPGIANAPVQ